MKYFLVSLRYDNFLQLKNSGYKLLGFPKFSRKIETVKPGDKFILYVGSGKSIVPGILEAKSEMFIERNLIWDDYFPKRVSVQKYILLDDEKYVSMREIKNGLSFIRPEVKKFGVYFMQGLRELSEEDYNYILRKVKENDSW